MEAMPTVSSSVEKLPQIPHISLTQRHQTIRHPETCSKPENDAICGLDEGWRFGEPLSTVRLTAARIFFSEPATNTPRNDIPICTTSKIWRSCLPLARWYLRQWRAFRLST